MDQRIYDRWIEGSAILWCEQPSTTIGRENSAEASCERDYRCNQAYRIKTLYEEDILPNTSTSAERILKTLNPAGNANTTMC